MVHNIVVIDTETTGFSHVNDGVVQVGIAWRDDNGDVNRWDKICNPGRQYFRNGRAYHALRVNKLKMRDIFKADPDHKVAEDLKRKLASIQEDKSDPIELRAYNNGFDRPFLENNPWNLKWKWGNCIMLQANEHFGTRKKLSDAVDSLGLKWPEGRAHHASVDSHAALLVTETIEGILN